MKLLHTSDWHLGRSLHGVDLHSAAESFIDQIVVAVAKHNIDCVVIAGDVFDRAIPPVESVGLFTEALSRLGEYAHVVVIPGNHDSAIRLSYGAALHREGIDIVSELHSIGTPINVLGTLIYPIPYLDPDHARRFLTPGEEPLARTHEAVMGAAMDLVRSDLLNQDQDSPAIVVAHAFVVGGEPSESERDIRVGGIDTIAAGVFKGVDYVALGHLHGPQQVRTSQERQIIRYSGSPIRFSFSEVRQLKSVTLIDFSADRTPTVTELAIDQPREMADLLGTLDDLLSADVVEQHADKWVRAIVTDQARPRDLQQRLRCSFEHILSIQHRPASDLAVIDLRTKGGTSQTDPLQLSAAFIEHVTNAAPSAAELTILRDALEAAGSEVVL